MRWVRRKQTKRRQPRSTGSMTCRDQLHETESWVDRWLPRLSHVSQFGLLLFTVGTLYFTVIPLYQKALLEEAIAKKEVELKLATQALEARAGALVSAQAALDSKVVALQAAQKALAVAELKTYVQKRQYDLDAFVRYSAMDCSGLLRRQVDISEIDVKIKRPEQYEETFKIDPRECLITVFRESRLGQGLQKPDLLLMQSTIAEMGSRLFALRAQAMKDVVELPERSKLDPSLLRPATGYSAQVEDFLAKIPASVHRRDMEAKLVRDVIRNQNRISDEYENALRKVVGTLAKVDWPIRLP